MNPQERRADPGPGSGDFPPTWFTGTGPGRKRCRGFGSSCLSMGNGLGLLEKGIFAVLSSSCIRERGVPNEYTGSDLVDQGVRERIAKGSFRWDQGRDRGGGVEWAGVPQPSLLMVWDSPLEILHSSLMCLVAATRTPGHHASSRNCGRGGAGANEGPATKGESHPKPGYCRAAHAHAAPQPPGPEKTS